MIFDFDNIYIRCFAGIAAFALCLFFIIIVIVPIDQQEYENQYNDYIDMLDNGATPNIQIDDGYFHGYDSTGLLIAAHGKVNKTGLKEEFKFTILPPFFKLVVVDL